MGLRRVGCRCVCYSRNRRCEAYGPAMRRAKGLRHDALRKAQQVKQDRDARRLRRERQVEAALADYFERMALATAVEQAAAAKVAAVEAAAATEVDDHRRAAGAALRAMLSLGETRTAVAELIGMTLAGVRELVAAADASETTAAVGESDHESLPDVQGLAADLEEPYRSDPSAYGVMALCSAADQAPAWSVGGWSDPPSWGGSAGDAADRWTA